MKRRLITVAICLLVALIPTCLIAIGASRQGLIPKSLEKYDSSVTVSAPSGDKFTYIRGHEEHSAISAAVASASLSDRETAESAATEYQRFDILFEGERRLSLSAYISRETPCGFIATSGDKYYRIGGDELLRLFKSEAFACLWVGESPPAAQLEGVTLKTGVVEWSYMLSDGTRVSSGEYISKSPVEYEIDSHKKITPAFASSPSSTHAVVYDADGVTLFEGSAEELLSATLPSDRRLGVMYSAEWQRGRESVRAAYAFVIPPTDG